MLRRLLLVTALLAGSSFLAGAAIAIIEEGGKPQFYLSLSSLDRLEKSGIKLGDNILKIGKVSK